MRQAGTLSNRDDAQRLADYLLTLGIVAKVEPDGADWALWIREEDQIPQATKELEQFKANPQAACYRQAADTAGALRKQQAREDQRRQKNLIEMRNRWDTKPGGWRVLTFALIAASVIVALLTDFGQNDSAFLRYLWFQPPPTTLLGQLNWSPTQSIHEGQVWRIFTPIFIHMSVLHLLFNMYWLYIFGSMIEMRRGTVRFACLVIAIAAISNWGEYFFSYRVNPFHIKPTIYFGGMSGVGYGLFGYLWMKSRFDPLGNVFLPPGTVFMFMIWFALCWSGMLGPIANWAHTTGLVAGMAIGYAPVAWRKISRN
jgi:GlpG protein